MGSRRRKRRIDDLVILGVTEILLLVKVIY
jgi:hypothetical protein